MRKWVFTGVTVIIIALVGFVWPYYTGKSIERFLTKKAGIQAFLAKGQTLNTVTIKRGWFSTEFIAQIDYLPKDQVGAFLLGSQQLPENPIGFKLDAKIKHGPILIGRDINGKFYFRLGNAFVNMKETVTPAAVAVLKKNGVIVQPLLSASGLSYGFTHRIKGNSIVYSVAFEDHPFFGNANVEKFTVNWKAKVSDKSVNYEFNGPRIMVKGDGEVISIKDYNASLTSAIPFDLGKMQWKVSLKRFKLREGDKIPLQFGPISASNTASEITFYMRDFNVDANGQNIIIPEVNYEHKFDVKEDLAGKARLKIPSIKLKIGEHTSIEVKKFNAAGQQKVSKDLLSGSGDLSVANIQYNKHTFGPIKLTSEMNKWFLPALLDYRDIINQMFWASSTLSDLQQRPNLTRREQLMIAQNKIQLIRLQYLAMKMWPKIVNQGASLSIEPLLLTFPSGKVKIKFNFKNPTMPNVDDASVLAQKASVDFKLIASKNIVHKALVFMLTQRTNSQVDAKQIEEKVQAELKKARDQKDLIAKGDNYELSLNYKDGKMLVNGHVINQSQVKVPMPHQLPAQVSTQVSGAAAKPTDNSKASNNNKAADDDSQKSDTTNDSAGTGKSDVTEETNSKKAPAKEAQPEIAS